MNSRTIFGVSLLAAVIAACDGGGVTLAPATTVTNSNNTTIEGGGAPAVNPCASYSVSGQTVQGTFAGGNCTYSAVFVSDSRPLTTDLIINELPDGGLHIFEDSLFVGRDVNANSAAQGVRIPQDGEGPTLTVAAGSKIAFSNPSDYVRVARGSRIIAEGTRSKPIIFSGLKDLRDNQATLNDRGLWGGIQINGNGLTNKCTNADRQPTASNPHNCHVTAEGRPATYGGVNNDENSGVLRYVQIRHAGFEVTPGDELNALTLNGVGRGTTIEYVQTYTTVDDGFEMFGGAVDLKYIVAVNVGDDSIDYSEGWTGNIQFALVVHPSGGNFCVEADNTGSGLPDDLQPFTKGRISNLTCITSGLRANEGTFPSKEGDSRGSIYREGVYFEEYNSIFISNAPNNASRPCWESASAQTVAGMTSGISRATGNVIACSDAFRVNPNLNFDLRNWWTNGGNVVIDSAASLPANLITGLSSSNPTAYITNPNMTDANGNPINVQVFDVTRLLDTFNANSAPALGNPGSSSFFEPVDFIGAVKEGDDWVAGWTIGL